ELPCLARRLRAAFILPDGFPPNGAKAGRAFYWLSAHQPGIAVPFAKAVFHNYFGEGVSSLATDVVIGIAAECGADAGKLASVLDSEELKTQFRSTTDEAIERG